MIKVIDTCSVLVREVQNVLQGQGLDFIPDKKSGDCERMGVAYRKEANAPLYQRWSCWFTMTIAVSGAVRDSAGVLVFVRASKTEGMLCTSFLCLMSPKMNPDLE